MSLKRVIEMFVVVVVVVLFFVFLYIACVKKKLFLSGLLHIKGKVFPLAKSRCPETKIETEPETALDIARQCKY